MEGEAMLVLLRPVNVTSVDRIAGDAQRGADQRNLWMMSNAISVIQPYWHAGTWVFDDPERGLLKEPFVSGIPEMINLLVKDIPNARNGFRLIFSGGPFPGHQKEFTWRRGEYGGNWYAMEDPPMEGWLCPALFKYFEAAPQKLYARAEPLTP